LLDGVSISSVPPPDGCFRPETEVQLPFLAPDTGPSRAPEAQLDARARVRPALGGSIPVIFAVLATLLRQRRKMGIAALRIQR
jgi:hypothetical protein